MNVLHFNIFVTYSGGRQSSILTDMASYTGLTVQLYPTRQARGLI